MNAKRIACVLLAVLLLALAGCSGSASSSAASGAASTAPAPSAASEAAEPAQASGEGLKVGFTDSYNGNTWRQTEEECFTNVAEELKSQGLVSEYSIVCANQDVTTQIFQINTMILDDYDIIVICPTSTTALCDVIDEAVDAGITVITAIDGIVETDSCYQLDQGSPALFGKAAADICALAEPGDKVIMSRGIVGLATEELVYQAQLAAVEEAGLEVVGEIESQWTDSVAKEALAQILPSLDWDVDVIIGQGGDDLTAIELFLDQGLEPPLVLGGNRGNFLSWWAAAYEESGYQSFSCAGDPWDTACALYIAVDIATGKVTFDDKILTAVGSYVSHEMLEADVEYFKNLPADAIYYEEHDHQWVVDNLYSEYAASYEG